ncbi:thiamine phosphate synthase [Bhargavaea ginsengi]|nr:thiamine phosphate synthase [Bhargavaea ginsengi]
MGSRNAGERDPLEVLEEALKGGITCFQLREKGPGAIEGRELRAFGEACRDLCRAYGVPFIVNDDVRLALELGADGVHIGQDDGDAGEVRRLIGDRILGVSVHNLDEVREAAAAGADYVGIGPVYQTTSKPDARPVCGTLPLREAAEAFPELPSVGIGGITAANAGPVIASGASGVSVITAISLADDPERAAREIRMAIEETIRRRRRAVT